MLRVMIVEDEDMIRKGLVFTIDWLSMDCVVVAEASNGQEGYERILEYKPDVVIADICMPFMDCIEMIQKASEKVCPALCKDLCSSGTPAACSARWKPD